MFPKSLTVLNSKCAHKQSCSVLATTSMFGDPCPGTHKYLEAHYQCISAAQTSTTTNRPSPPWVLTNNPPLLANGSAIISPGSPLQPIPGVGRLPLPAVGNTASNGSPWNTLPPSPGPPQPTLPGGRLKGGYNTTVIKNANRHDGLPPPPPLHHHHHGSSHRPGGVDNNSVGTETNSGRVSKDDTTKSPATTNTKVPNGSSNTTTSPNTRILSGVGGAGNDDETLLNAKPGQNRANQQHPVQQNPTGNTTIATATAGSSDGNFSGVIRTINNINNLNIGMNGADETNMFCPPRNVRNLFWNITRVGDVNVQPCPGGATGIAKWRCVLVKRFTFNGQDDNSATTETPSKCEGNSTCEINEKVSLHMRNFEPTWHPLTPDLTQCRSLWLNNLEVRVNQRDSSLISIANDLSEVTSSKTLYGGDMLVTTKIIQTMSEKMFHDKETFPDQRQREAIIMELLHGVVKTGSNLLDESQLSSWLDLNQEDQMRVATSLLTGLEYNAFLLADTIIRERNVVQKVKNILLSVRVLETKNIQGSEVFPDSEQWQISDDHIELPRTALIENSEGGLVRIVFAAFDRLESILKPSYDHFDVKSARSYVRNTAILTNDSSDVSNGGSQQQRIRILNSKVISASLGKGRHIQLSQPIKLVLRHLKTENVTNPTCVFWNYIDHAWSANGCSLESTNRTHSICVCNHLTNFAILMDVMDEHNQSLFGIFKGNMRIFIYISISICLVFIVIALLTLKIFNGVFIKSARTSIYRNIYICLLLIEILFLFGIEQNETSILCGFTTVFLHCTILSAIAWFCFEAFHSYCTLTTDDIPLEVDQTSKVNCYYLLPYGVAFTIVAISSAINPNTYTQNDFCVLMEANTLFYATFVTPVVVFLIGTMGYTFLSWITMCHRSRTTLKNKEHTRLANVRFDIRCSFIFLLLLNAMWIAAYYYLRLAKAEESFAVVCGYMFVSFNTLMGLYIFVFHCIQNEKIRREYRKYVRQNSWLPKCLRCSKTSISSGVVGSTNCASGAIGGNLSGNSRGGVHSMQKKSKLPISDGNENEENGGIMAASEDAIIASSDCELNEAQMRRLQSGADCLEGSAKSEVLGGNLVLQHGRSNSIVNSLQGQILLERGDVSVGGSHTLRSVGGGGGGAHTPSAGHTSPTSSAGSTHLIFGAHHKQQISADGALDVNGMCIPQDVVYHQPDYFNWKQQGAKGGVPMNAAFPREYSGNLNQAQQAHEFFYWTQKHHPHSKKKRTSAMGSESPSGSLHSRTTAASQQILFYPSYKKTTMKHQPPQHQQYPHYAETMETGGGAAYYPQQHRRHPSAAMMVAAHHQQQHQQQQQLSSDDEQMESPAHTHLLHLGRRGGPQPHLPPPPAHPYHHHHSPEFAGVHVAAPAQRYYRNKHSNCDLSHEEYCAGDEGEQYYNQNSLSGGEGPVYEEILSNRNSDIKHYDMHENMADPKDYGADENSRYEEESDVSSDEGDLDVGGGLPQASERMRRLMAMQDEDFQRRFQRQQKKSGLGDSNAASGYYDTQPAANHHSNASFGASSGHGGSVKSFKKISPNSRVAINDLFSHGPPLPPANQYPLTKRQQQQSSPSAVTPQLPHLQQQQQPVGRNISAMLDENNTVRCYLEPLSK